MPGGSTTGAPDWRDAAKLRKFLADDIPQWTPSEGAENTRAFLAALREKCSTEIGAMTGLLLALFEERVDASKAGYELAQKLKRGGGGATPREELDMEMLFGDTKDFESTASVEVKTEQVDWTPELEAKWRAQVKGVLKLITHMVVSNTNPKIRDSLSVERSAKDYPQWKSFIEKKMAMRIPAWSGRGRSELRRWAERGRLRQSETTSGDGGHGGVASGRGGGSGDRR